jgi:hypothetical protein
VAAVQDFGGQIRSWLIGVAGYVQPRHHFFQVRTGGYDTAILSGFHHLGVQAEHRPKLLNVPAVWCHRCPAAAMPQLRGDHFGQAPLGLVDTAQGRPVVTAKLAGQLTRSRKYGSSIVSADSARLTSMAVR